MKNRKFDVLIILFFLSINVGCFLEAGYKNEMVMTEGMIIEAKNEYGKIAIEATSDTNRIVFWDDKKDNIALSYRKKRWNGSLGAYNPGGGSRHYLIVEEGQQFFCSEKETMEWIKWQKTIMNYVYTSDGLLIGFDIANAKNKSYDILKVKIWQIYINKNKPIQLPGAINNNVKRYFKKEYSPKYPVVGNFMPNTPHKINGRSYSGKAMDVMNEMGMSPSMVEELINSGIGNKYEDHFIYRDSDEFSVGRVKTDLKGRVVLVWR